MRDIPEGIATLRATISTASSGDNTIVAAATNNTIRIHKMIISPVASAVTLLFKNGASSTLLTVPFSAGGCMVLDLDDDPWFITSAGSAFILNLSGAVQVYGRVFYTQSRVP